MPRYFFVVTYADHQIDDPDGTLLPADAAARQCAALHRAWAAERNYGRAVSGSVKDPILLIVAMAIACIVGVVAYATVVTVHEHTTAVQNNQTDVAQHH
jgi:hypothetical protein